MPFAFKILTLKSAHPASCATEIVGQAVWILDQLEFLEFVDRVVDFGLKKVGRFGASTRRNGTCGDGGSDGSEQRLGNFHGLDVFENVKKWMVGGSAFFGLERLFGQTFSKAKTLGAGPFFSKKGGEKVNLFRKRRS